MLITYYMHRRTIRWEMSVFVEGTIDKKSKKQREKEQEEEEEGEGKEAEANQDNNFFSYILLLH